MMTSQIWFRLNGGLWNNNNSADPASMTGGLLMTYTKSKHMYAVIHGSGSSTLTANFGQSGFAESVPVGYSAGWPNGGGWSTLDPTKSYGSPTLSNGNLTGTSGGFWAGVTISGYQHGNFYFETTINTFPLASDYVGIGVMRYDWATFQGIWALGAKNSDSDLNGGGNCTSDVTYAVSLYATQSATVTNAFSLTNGAVICCAVHLEAANHSEFFLNF